MADFLSLHPLSTNSTELCQMGIVMVNFFFQHSSEGSCHMDHLCFKNRVVEPSTFKHSLHGTEKRSCGECMMVATTVCMNTVT